MAGHRRPKLHSAVRAGLAEAVGALSVRRVPGWAVAALLPVWRDGVPNAPFTGSLKFVGLASRLAETALETIGTMLAGITRNAVVAGLARARARLTHHTLDTIGTVRTDRTLLTRRLLSRAMRARFARDAASPVFRAGFAGAAEDADSDLAVLTRGTGQALCLGSVRLGAGRAGRA